MVQRTFNRFCSGTYNVVFSCLLRVIEKSGGILGETFNQNVGGWQFFHHNTKKTHKCLRMASPAQYAHHSNNFTSP